MSERVLRMGRIISMPLDENAYIAHFDGDDECIVFDPGFDPEAIIEYIEEHGLTPAAIICTHGHGDHIAGNRALKQRWPGCPIVIGVGDAPKLIDPDLNFSSAFGFSITSPPADRTLREGERFDAAGMELDVLETPGHSIGHIVLLCRQTNPWQVIGGDVLFQGSVGRTDIQDGDFDALRTAIHDKLFTLPDDTIVLPGHGSVTTIGREKRTNPFVGNPAGYVV